MASITNFSPRVWLNSSRILWQDLRLRIFIILLAFALITWFGGPYIAINGNSFLANSNHRLVAVLLLAIVWGLLNLRITHKKFSTQNAIAEKTLPTATVAIFPNHAMNTEIKQFQKTFKHSLSLLKRSEKKRFWNFMQLPTFIVLGINHAGKTSLLTQANRSNPLPLFSEKYYDGWLINDAIFFDYIENEIFDKTGTSTLLWQKFLKLIKKHKYKLRFNGIVLTIDLSQLLNQSTIFNGEKICQRLQDMSIFAQIPVYLVFTHCDLIAGFTDFFEDLNQEERSQTLGFTFPNIKTSRNFSEIFNMQLNTLLKRLNERLIWRLHQEHNPQKRGRIKDFPLQLEVLKNSISNIVNQIGNITNIKLCGSYFTGCSQQQSPINFLTNSLEKNFHLKQYTATISQKISSNKNFFLENLFQQIINTSLENTQRSSRNTKLHLLFYLISLGLIIGCSAFWLTNYAENLATINTLQLAISNNKNFAEQGNLYDFLPHLTQLYTALEKIDKHHSLWLHLGLQQADQVKIFAAQAYQELLATRFLPMLKNVLENKLTTMNPQNLAETFNTLKVYLMLTTLNHREPEVITDWFATYWQQQFPNKSLEQRELLTQLTQLFQEKLVITGNTQLVTTIQNNLNNIPLSQLIYAQLLMQYQTPSKIMNKNDVLQITNNYSIPELYTAKNFSTVYQKNIPALSQAMLNNGWVLGSENTNLANLEQLISQLQYAYLQQYANAWSQLLSQITLQDPQNLTQIIHTFNLLGSNNSPLWQLLRAINVNTAMQENAPQFNLIVSNKFQALNLFIQSPSYTFFQKALANTKNYFDKIGSAIDPEKAAFVAAAKRMDNIDQKDVLANLSQQTPNLPQPLQAWNNSLAINGWHQLLSATQLYLNQIWSSAVIPQYHATLENKYPLFKDSNNDITLQDFATFFAPNGIMDSFFNHYLKPFVDTHNVYWVWKVVDNDQIAIPQTTLEMFIRAAVIQKMYFANGDTQPLVKFTLTPLAIEPGVLDFNLNLDGQIINFQPDHPAGNAELSWPGPFPNNVTLQFTNSQGKSTATTEMGPWAWFRLLAKANLQTAWKNPRQFKVTFDLNGNSAKYELTANDLVNPFIAGIVDVFRCPEKL